MEKKSIITPSIVIEAMRDNGYKNAAYALAEIVDNSIQAGSSYVKILSYEYSKKVNTRVSKQVDTIAILDNGCGMTADELYFALAFGESTHKLDKKGMGKFGMGLPNSSISQCKRVEVWSWKNLNNINYTYLDIDEIVGGREHVPIPINKTIPKEIDLSLDEPLPESGTLVVWTKLDRLQWSTSKTLFRHSEMRIGRMYRKFISEKKAAIRFLSFEVGSNGVESVEPNCQIRANDPMYLIKNETFSKPLPDEFEEESFFQINEEFEKEYSFNNEIHIVKFRSTYPKRNIWDHIRKIQTAKPGSTPWGVHCRENFGLSVMRSGREIDLIPSFITWDKSDFRDLGRFCSLEIEFPPSLDKPFGLLNNKQQAVNLKPMDRDKDAAYDGFSDSTKQFINSIERRGSGREILYDVVSHIKIMRNNIYHKLAVYPTGNQKQSGDDSESAAGKAATAGAKARAKEWETAFDAASLAKQDVIDLLRDTGESSSDAEKIAVNIIRTEEHFHFSNKPLNSSAFFDVTTKNGFALVQINENHLFYKKVLSKVNKEERVLLEVILGAWARLEHETSNDQQLNRLQIIRSKWGEILDTFYDVDELS